MHTVCLNNVTGINGILYCDDGEACCGVGNYQWCCQGHGYVDNTLYIAILIAVSTAVSLALLIVSVFVLKYLKTRQRHRTDRIIGLSRRLAYVDTPSQASQTDSNGGLSPMAATYPHIGGGKFEHILPQNQARVKGKELSAWSVRPNILQVSPVPKVIYRPIHYQTVDRKSRPLDDHVANNGKQLSLQNSHRTEKQKILLPTSTSINSLTHKGISASNSNEIIRGDISKLDHHETNAGKILSPDTQKPEDGEISSPDACEKMDGEVTQQITQEFENSPHTRKIIDGEISSSVAHEKLCQEISSPCDHTTNDCNILSPDVPDTVSEEMSSSEPNGPVYSEISSPYANAINGREISYDAQQTIIGEISTSDSHETYDEKISTPVTSKTITDDNLLPTAQETFVNETLSPSAQETITDKTLSPVAKETIANEILSPVAQEPIVNETLSLVALATLDEETLSPVVCENVHGGMSSTVIHERSSEEISPNEPSGTNGSDVSPLGTNITIG